jgi:anti-sigma B factor antagonist
MSVLDLRVSSSPIGERAYLIAVSGEVDLYSAADVQARLAELIEGDAREIVVDVTGVTFLDSSGLGVLVAAAKALRSSGGELILAADNHGILRLLEITGLGRAFRVESSLVEAVQHVVERHTAV